jgi:hypothetical protein
MIRLVPDQDVAKRQTQAASAVNQTVHAPSAPLPNNASLFQDAARQAAIGDGRSIPLSTIDTDQPGITVIRLSRDRLLENQRLSEPAWVSLPPELLALCRGKSDALLAIQRVLGTPAYETIADRDAYALYQFVVPPVALFRPCASGAHVTDRTCATRPPKQQDTPIDLEARNFALQTYWDSFHPSPGRKAYPFTGMGWSYDWSPESTTRVGISELLVKAETSITAVK